MTQKEEIQALIDALDAGLENRRKAQSALLAMGDVVVEPLIAVVSAGEGQKGWAAAEILGRLADPRAFPVLVSALQSQNPMLAGMAVKALLNYKKRNIIPFLLSAFPTVQTLTKQNILLALQTLNDTRVVPFLTQYLNQSESPSIKTAIIQTLGKLGDPAAIPAIRQHLNDRDPHIRQWAAAAIQQLSPT
jgi:HEAT repeat protein